MRPIQEVDLNSITGSTYGDRVEFNLWYDGTLIRQDLPVSAWSLGWTADRQIQGQASLTVEDTDGTLTPYSLGDPLSPGGARIQAVWIFGATGNRIPLGWFRIRQVQPRERWRIADGVARLIWSAGSIPVQADELTCQAKTDRFLAPESVVRGATCVTEIRRLLRDIMPVVAPMVKDRPAPSDTVFEKERLDAVEDLLNVLDAVARMTGDGALEILPKAPGDESVWRLEGGDAGVLVDVRRTLSDDGVYNAASSSNATKDSPPRNLVGRATLTTGPLRFDGPFGRSPVFHKAAGITQAEVNADAQSTLDASSTGRQSLLPVECLTNPALQLHDRVTVVQPTMSGGKELRGTVTSVKLSSAGGGSGSVPAKSMSIEVSVSVDDLITVSQEVAHERNL